MLLHCSSDMAYTADLAPVAGPIQPKDKIDEKLLSILVHDPTAASVIGKCFLILFLTEIKLFCTHA